MSQNYKKNACAAIAQTRLVGISDKIGSLTDPIGSATDKNGRTLRRAQGVTIPWPCGTP